MKTITMRLKDDVYQTIKLAALGQKRSLSNFIEFATLQYLNSSNHIDDLEMTEILNDKDLVKNLKNGLKDTKKEDWTVV